jgi:nucleoside-diphosphate-sugar epimerase
MRDDEPPFSVADAVRAIVGSPEIRRVLKRSKLVKKLHDMVGQSGLRRFIDGAASQAPLAKLTVAGSTEGRPPLWLSDLYNGNRVRFSAQRAGDTLGWSPRISLDVARERTVQWLREGGFYRTEPA